MLLLGHNFIKCYIILTLPYHETYPLYELNLILLYFFIIARFTFIHNLTPKTSYVLGKFRKPFLDLIFNVLWRLIKPLLLYCHIKWVPQVWKIGVSYNLFLTVKSAPSMTFCCNTQIKRIHFLLQNYYFHIPWDNYKINSCISDVTDCTIALN